MDFPYGQTVTRERRKPIPDPYNPERTTPGEWTDELDSLELLQAFVASSSSANVADATRTQVLTSKSLYCIDPTVDVVAGDRVKVAGEPPYYVNARPAADVNPFTGWQPAVEIPLDLTEG